MEMMENSSGCSDFFFPLWRIKVGVQPNGSFFYDPLHGKRYVNTPVSPLEGTDR